MSTLDAERASKSRMFHLPTILWKKLFLSTFVLASSSFSFAPSGAQGRNKILPSVAVFCEPCSFPPSSDSAVSIQTPLFFSRWTWGGPVFVFLQGPSEGRPWLRRVLPIHCHLRLRSVTLISSCFVSLKRSALEICLGQKMRAIFLRQVVWKDLQPLEITKVILQHSEPWHHRESTQDWQILTFVARLYFPHLHRGRNCMKVTLALLILCLISRFAPA